MDNVNSKINLRKSLLKEAKKEEQKSEDILQNVKYVKYLKKEVTICKKRNKIELQEKTTNLE